MKPISPSMLDQANCLLDIIRELVTYSFPNAKFVTKESLAARMKKNPDLHNKGAKLLKLFSESPYDKHIDCLYEREDSHAVLLRTHYFIVNSGAVEDVGTGMEDISHFITVQLNIDGDNDIFVKPTLMPSGIAIHIPIGEPPTTNIKTQKECLAAEFPESPRMEGFEDGGKWAKTASQNAIEWALERPRLERTLNPSEDPADMAGYFPHMQGDYPEIQDFFQGVIEKPLYALVDHYVTTIDAFERVPNQNLVEYETGWTEGVRKYMDKKKADDGAE